MSSHTHSGGSARPTTTGPWVVVAVLIAAALVIGGGLIAASVVLLVIGTALVGAGLIGAAVLGRHGAAPVSFTQEFPKNTPGPRGTTDGDSSPPIDTDSDSRSRPAQRPTAAARRGQPPRLRSTDLSNNA